MVACSCADLRSRHDRCCTSLTPVTGRKGEAGSLRWRVDGNVGMDLQEVLEPTCMVTVPVRDHRAIELPEVDSHCCCVLCKGAGTIASIEEQALAVAFD